MSRHSGHIILFKSAIDFNKYMDLDFAKKSSHYIEELRKILYFINPENYRGTGRQFFSSDPYFYDNGIIKQYDNTNLSAYDNLKARQLFAKLEADNIAYEALYDSYFFSFNEIQSVYELIENKGDYEIVEFLENEFEIKSTTLGFDVGYLASDYSVIADTAIKPRWHPPDFDDLQDIIEHLKKLNQYCLFSTLQEAKDYRALYLTKNWVEKETYQGQLTTIQIRTA